MRRCGILSVVFKTPKCTSHLGIGLGAQPGGNEGAGAALPAPPKSALDGLITCGSCGKPMLRDDTRGEQEACSPAGRFRKTLAGILWIE